MGEAVTMKAVRRQTEHEWRLIYDAFLASPQWAHKRERILKRAHAICECCSTQRATQVHHTSYPRPLTLDALDNQPDWQLRAICSTCHKTLHT